MNYFYMFSIILILLTQSLLARETMSFQDEKEQILINSNQLFLTNEEKEFIKKHPTIRFRVRPNLPPFEFVENGIPSGIAIDYIKKSIKNIGLNAEFIINNDPLDKAHHMIESGNGDYDTILFAVKSEERAKKFSFGSKFLSYPMMIITHNNSPNIKALKDLKNKTIVLEQGFLTNHWIKRDFPSIKINTALNTKEALEMVNNENVVAYIGNLGVAMYMRTFGKMNNLKISAHSGYGNIDYSVVAPKQWPELASLLTKGFKLIKPIEHSYIQQKWFSIQTIEKTDYKLLWQTVLGLTFIIILILLWNRRLTIEKNKTNRALVELEKSKREELEGKDKLLQAEKKISLTSQLLNESQQIAKLGGWKLNIKTGDLFWTDETYRIHDTSPEEFNPTVDAGVSYFLPESKEIISKALDDAINKGIGYDLELETYTTKGRKIDVRTTCRVTQENGVPIELMGIFQDITLQHKINKELKQKKNEFETIIQEAPNPMILYREGGEIIMINRAWSKSSGFSIEDTPTINDWIELTRDDEEVKASLKKHIDSLYEITETVNEGEFTFFNKNRDLITWQVSSSPLGLMDGKKTVITSAMDITNLKETERLLVNQSKMAAMGEMLGNIAHQWRQPLSIISSTATGAKLQNEVGLLNRNNINSYFDTINNTAQHLSQIIEGFRNFFNPSNKVKEFNISNTINETLQLISSQFTAKDIQFIENIEDFKIVSIENEMVQVLVNILNNARDALLTKENQRRLIFIDTYRKDNISYIKILDNAGGIEESIINRIFEPYFTTKHQSVGTGIGLYMSEEIIRKHLNGNLFVSNKKFTFEGIEYTGAEFVIGIITDKK